MSNVVISCKFNSRQNHFMLFVKTFCWSVVNFEFPTPLLHLAKGEKATHENNVYLCDYFWFILKRSY